MPAKYASADAGLRFAMALLLLVSATTKVMETTAIPAYMQAYGVRGVLVRPAACLRIRRRPLPAPRLSYPRGVTFLLAGWCLLTALIFHRQFSDLDQLDEFLQKPDDGRRISMAGQG
jgi:putative oxidoreductase